MNKKPAVPGSPKSDDSAKGRDSERQLDGCEITVQDPTPDEDLPAAEGGVA
jgi:hypothetical protein